MASLYSKLLRAQHIPARQAGPTSIATTRDAKHHTQAAQAEEQTTSSRPVSGIMTRQEFVSSCLYGHRARVAAFLCFHQWPYLGVISVSTYYLHGFCLFLSAEGVGFKIIKRISGYSKRRAMKGEKRHLCLRDGNCSVPYGNATA